MTTLLAYCDPISAAPGETVRVMVSCEGADRYQAEIVRLINPQAAPAATPFRTEPVAASANGSHAGRVQPIHAGSHGEVGRGEVGRGEVAAHDLIGSLESFTVQAMIWPTTPGKGRQALLGTWSEITGTGFGLAIDNSGALELRIGDGTRMARVTSGRPLTERRWYLVAGSFDAATGRLALVQEPLAERRFHPEKAVTVAAPTDVRLAPGPGPFLFAAWHAGQVEGPAGRVLARGHYNGKIDRPRLANRALDRAEMAALAGGVVPAGLEQALVASWDLSRDIPSERLIDTSPNRLHGITVNLPTRAMTGHNWTGEVMDWTRAPEHYGAIHFHDDDLVDAGWATDFSFTVPAGLRSAVYAAKLTANEAEFWVPFFVRPPRGEARAPIAFLASTATYIAYINNRGRFASSATELYHGRLAVMDAIDIALLTHPEIGLSTYDRHSDGSGVCYSSRLRPATNLRPTGRHWNFNIDLFIIDWLEHLGVAYDVITEEDLHAEGLDLLRPYRVVVTGSHPEYDSAAMLDAFAAHLRQGGRLMYMGGNGFYWRIAHHPERPGVIEVRRAEGGVRAWDALPGEYHHSFTGEYGGLWRRQERAPNQLVGVGFISQGFDACSYYRRTAASSDPRAQFMFEGVDGELLGDAGLLQGGAAGLEIDSVDKALGTPDHALVVARSENHSNTYELVAEEVRIPHGATDAIQNPAIHADMVFFETPGGGAVFSTGSIAYAGSLCCEGFDNDLARLTSNVLRRFADPAPFTLPTDDD